jgi:hypothetical protein
MASFVETAIPQFNPYIQQLPLETMAAVGMEKQRRYDEGIQRIQSQIDQVAGLDIARDVDRQYLQSKLNDLGSKLRTVAAGDFSNYQLVNSTAGMAASVAKDQNVINSVQSTAQRRNVMQRMQKDIQDGKTNPANDYIFSLTDSDWFNNPNVGAKYTGDYSTPIDVWGKIKDIAKEVGVDEKTIQQLYETDSLGRIQYNADGSPKWNNIMVEKTFKGKDASKILKAFESALTPADYKQLSIEGRYNYRGATPEMLIQEITRGTDQQITMNKGKIEMLRLALADENRKGTSDPEVIQSIKDQIEFFENQNSSFETSKVKNIEAINANPEAVKASLFTNRYLSNMSQALSSQDVSTKYSVSPMFEVSMRLNEFKQKQEQWLADYNLKLRQDTREQQKHDAAMKKLAEEAAYYQSGGIDMPIDVDDVSVRAMVEGEYSDLVTQYNTASNQLAIETLRMANPGVSDEELMKKLYDVAAAENRTLNPSSGEINKTAQTIASAIIQKYNSDPKSIEGKARGLVEQQLGLLKAISAKEAVISTAKQNAEKQAELLGLDSKAYERVLNSIKPETITLKNGQSVTLSQKDIVDFINLRPDLFNVVGELSTDKEQSRLRSQAEENLKARFGPRLYNIMEVLYPVNVSGGYSPVMQSPSPLLLGKATAFRDAQQNDFNRIIADEYRKIGAIPMGKVVTVTQGDQKPQDYQNKFMMVVSKYGNLNPDEFEEVTKSIVSGNFTATIVTQPGTTLYSPSTYTLNFAGADGVKREIPIERGDYKALTGYEPPMNPAVKNAYDLVTAKGTTNIGQSGVPETSYYKSEDFPNFKSENYSITADLETGLSDPNLLYPKIYIYDKKTGELIKPFSIDTPIPKTVRGQINPALETFGLGITQSFIKETTNFQID